MTQGRRACRIFTGGRGVRFTFPSARTKENAMKSRLPVRLVMMLAALVLSLVPAAAAVRPADGLSTCDRAQFVADVTVPDGAKFAPGSAFTKTWRLKNVGTCTWSTSYSLVFSSGEPMGGPASIAFPLNVPPGQMVDLS